MSAAAPGRTGGVAAQVALLLLILLFCVFPFYYRDLKRFYELEETPYERAESIELLRAIEHGELVQMVEVEGTIKSVDTEEDRVEVERLMSEDATYSRYRP